MSPTAHHRSPMRLGTPGLALAALLAAGAAAGQSVERQLAGVALGPDGEPLVGVRVLLHAVGQGGGAMAGIDTTGPGGAFGFPLAAGDTVVYFAALRHEGQIYIGPTVAPGDDPATDYVLRVGPATEIGTVGAALSNPRPPAQAPAQAPARPGPDRGGSSDAGALWLVAALAVVAAGVFVYTAPRYRQRRTREALLEVAGIENRLADAGLDAEERDRLESRRDRLKGRLAPAD